ncbi:hypothetical protein JR316_0012833 [Psilocybe cubensis]|uniref:Uncharacterized protein n=2 Tax=Psilocybe cubensis TaxID=181762 RepID=A0ACB8GG16_PSICU|nr:hypothetical protein JR316_0012833 [Psilocybe cubensis]KAH9474375.1 hypothetical protein JR316_0012833 [Psilocybe cubensis]
MSNFDVDIGAMDEVIFRLQGIVSDKMLPPMAKPASRDRTVKQQPYLRTAIAITGLGDIVFNKVIEKLEEVFLHFANNFPADSVSGYDPVLHKDTGFNVFHAHSQYFTKVSAYQDKSDNIGFHPLVDPDNVLASMVGDSFIHAINNKVQFLRREILPDGTARYYSYNPASIRIGDIVEISVAFVAFPAQGNKYKFVVALRGILVLDQEAREKADILRMRSRYTPAKRQVAVLCRTKRQLYKGQIDIEDTQQRMARMRLNEDTVHNSNTMFQD